MRIRRFEERDAGAVSALITETLLETNRKDYPEAYLTELTGHMRPEDILSRAAWQHLYVVEEDGALAGCGAIGPWWGREDESGLFTVFVRPAFQGRGLGRAIVETLEQDAFFLRARRVEVPASLTGLPFYLKLGYTYKDGVTEPDDERLVHLEKFREV